MIEKPERIVLPIHFEDRSGIEFERLCFAYLLRIKEWDTIDWYGQLGSDRGRDIWGTIEGEWGTLNYCYQCANFQRLNFKKVQEDIDKICSGNNSIPDYFTLVCGGKISAGLKIRIAEYGKQKKIHQVESWSGVEFEERLRMKTPSLIKRFVEGESFPESVEDLRRFLNEEKDLSDGEILTLFAQCFDRPAFLTPFWLEGSIPDFKQAITDTIEVLNTGIHRTRRGEIIREIPSRHKLKDQKVKDTLSDVTTLLIELRETLEGFIRSGKIEVRQREGHERYRTFDKDVDKIMNEKRVEILKKIMKINPDYKIDFHRLIQYTRF